MTYSVLRLIEVMGDQFSELLNTVLTRVPVLVVGKDVELVDDLTESLALLCPHRRKLLFWRDFTTEEEIQTVWDEEKHDYEVSRTVVIGLASNLRLALDRISQFMGWIMSVPLEISILGLRVTEDSLSDVVDRVSGPNGNCGVLRVESPSVMAFSLARQRTSTLAVERRIVSKILKRKHQSLERIRRLLKKSLRGVPQSNSLLSVVLQLDDESEKITRDVFDEEIGIYVHAARRAVTLLSRIRLAREFDVPAELTERNLCEAIGWDGGALTDLLQFMRAEWHEDFSDCVKGSTLSDLGAWVDSMWGG